MVKGHQDFTLGADVKTIPGVGEGVLAKSIWVPPEGTKYITIEGAGRLLYVDFHVYGDDRRDALRPHIKCDGVQVFPYYLNTLKEIERAFVDEAKSPPLIGWSIWDTVNYYYGLQCAIPFPFRQKLEIGAYNEHTTETKIITIYAVYELVK